MSQFEATTFIESHYAHYIIFGCSTLGLVWGAVNAFWVKKVEIDHTKIQLAEAETDKEESSSDRLMTALGFTVPTDTMQCK